MTQFFEWFPVRCVKTHPSQNVIDFQLPEVVQRVQWGDGFTGCV